MSAQLSRLFTRYRVVGIFLAHSAIVAASFLVAFLLRFEFRLSPSTMAMIHQTLPALLIIRLSLFYRYHLFSGWWHYVGISDIVDILKSVTVGTVCFVMVIGLGRVAPGFPRSVVALEWLLTVQLLAGVRIASRLVLSLLEQAGIGEQRDVLIVASPAMGESLLRELTAAPSDLRPIGFVIAGGARYRRIQRLPVLGTLDDLGRVLSHSSVREVLIGLSADAGDGMREAIRACRTAKVRFRLISPVRDYLEQPRMLEEPNLEELFAAERVLASGASADVLLRDRTVVIFGAAGIIGAALAARIAAARPRRLLLFDRDESALYYLEIDLVRRFPMVPVTPLVGDVLDPECLHHVLATHRPQLVIHGAAYCGEALAETNREEVRRNNLAGFARVLEASVDSGVERVMLLSFDEADFGSLTCLQRAAEYHMRRERRGGTVACAVRFPRVVGSPQSPVAMIAQALQRREPVVVAAPDASIRITTLGAIVPVLLESLAIARDGDVLAIDAGETRTVEDVVRYMRHVWNLPDESLGTSPALPDHFHPLEIGESTVHPQIVRRTLESEPPPCVGELLRELPAQRESAVPLRARS